MYNLDNVAKDFPWTRVTYNRIEPWREEGSNWFNTLPDGWGDVIYNGLVKLDHLLQEHNAKDRIVIEQVKEKWGCYDEQTEVLTKKGWKFFKDVTYEDEIMTLNLETNEIEYHYPTDIIRYKYKGKMYKLCNRGIDLCVTPNHNLYVAKGSYYNHKKDNEKRTYPMELCVPDKYFRKDKRFLKAGNIWKGINPEPIFSIEGYQYSANYIRNGKEVKRTYTQKGVSINIEDWLCFLGFYVAEGYSSVNKGEIAVAYNPKDEEELVCNLIKNIGFKVHNGTRCKKFYNKAVAKWLNENCGHKAPNKKVPDFIKQLSPYYIEMFLKYLYIGDGHQGNTSLKLTTTSKQLKDDVEELLLKCGYAFRTFTRDRRGEVTYEKNTGREIIKKHISYDINWLKNVEIEIDMSKVGQSKSFVEEWVDYDDYVSCVTVPNHIIYVKRNDKGLWCGNSLRFYFMFLPREKEISDEEYAAELVWQDECYRIVNEMESETARVCYNCGTRDNIQCYGGWVHFACPACEKKRIEEFDL